MILSTLLFRHPRLTLLFIGFIVIAGLGALSAISRQEDPALTERWGNVVTYLPGASAGRVEALVTEKIENALQEIEEIKRISSRSQAGWSVVSMQLEDDIMAVDGVWARVRDKVSEVEPQLPPTATVPEFDRPTVAAFTLLVGFTWTLDDQPQLDLLNRMAENLRQRLIRLSGTKEVKLFGEPEEEVQVVIEPDVLASAGLTVAAVSEAIHRADSKNAAGRIDSERNSVVVEVRGAIGSVDRIRSIPLRHGKGGQLLRVGDVASVIKAPRSPPRTLTLVDGEPGIIVGIKIENNRRVDKWAAWVRDVVAEFRADLPSGVKADIIFDQSIHTEERLGSLVENLLIGAGLVFLVLLVMMGWRSAVLVASALPLTLLMVMVVLNAMGVPLQQISLTGLIIAIGLLIDNAIVVIDEYNKDRRRGLSPSDAIASTVGHLFRPLLASTLTTTFTFLPLVLMPGNAGEFVSTLGISVILAINFSLVLSLTIVPTVAGYFDRGQSAEPRSGVLAVGIGSGWVVGAYRGLLRTVVRRPLLGIFIALILPLSGFGVASQLVEQFFPPVNRNQFQVQIKLPPQSSLAETRANVARARELIHAHPQVTRSHWFIGEKPPRVYYNITISEDASPDFAFGFIDTTSPDETFAMLAELQHELISAFPNATVLALPFEQGPPVEAPIELRVYGPDLDTLRRLGEEIRLVLTQTRQVTYAEASISGARPTLALYPDEDQARFGGLDPTGVAARLDAGLSGVTGGTILEGTKELPIRVRLSPADRTEIAGLIDHRLLSASGNDGIPDHAIPGVPLKNLVRAELVPDVSLITRRHGERVNTVSAFVRPFSLPGKALADFRARLAASGFTVPNGYRLEYGGESEGSGEARAALISVLAPLLILMIATVVLAFDSFRMAAIIGMVAVFSVGGALLTLWLFGFPMGFMAVIGTMGLIGLAINDSIVVLSLLHTDERCRAADADAICDTVVEATRHIISTTLTTIGGFLPLIIWGGIFWPPLAIAVAGGMVGATLLALFFVPPMFTIFVRRAARRAAKQTMEIG
ncbi:MAG: efflux RND transporter permease subunit [Rhodospirillales bacterium]|nr:efflux RND transporter permease subunit [Rhodospirillales bacterium]